MAARVDWVAIPTDVLMAARARKGLSREAVARQLPISSKTYERWEKDGRIPLPDVPRVAEILDLEIERAERAKVTLPAGVASEAPAGRSDGDLVSLFEAIQDVRDEVLGLRGDVLLLAERLPPPGQPEAFDEQE